jgi:hypothetical protein
MNTETLIMLKFLFLITANFCVIPIYVSVFVMICIFPANMKRTIESFIVKLQKRFLKKSTPGRDQLSTLSLQLLQTGWNFTVLDMITIDIGLLAMVSDYKK